MSQLGKVVVVVFCIGLVSLGGWSAVAALRSPSKTDKSDVEKTLRVQRDLAHVQRNEAMIANLTMQIGMVRGEMAAQVKEVQAFCQEKNINFDELVKGNVVLADDGTLKSQSPPLQSPPSSKSQSAPTGVKP